MHIHDDIRVCPTGPFGMVSCKGCVMSESTFSQYYHPYSENTQNENQDADALVAVALTIVLKHRNRERLIMCDDGPLLPKAIS